MFKSILIKTYSERYKSKEQKRTLENIELFDESRQAFIKLFNDYSSIVSENIYKTIYGKGIPNMSARVVRGKKTNASKIANITWASKSR